MPSEHEHDNHSGPRAASTSRVHRRGSAPSRLADSRTEPNRGLAASDASVKQSPISFEVQVTSRNVPWVTWIPERESDFVARGAASARRASPLFFSPGSLLLHPRGAEPRGLAASRSGRGRPFNEPITAAPSGPPGRPGQRRQPVAGVPGRDELSSRAAPGHSLFSAGRQLGASTASPRAAPPTTPGLAFREMAG